ncbi:MAG TPA: SRPBCC family protein [Thermoplasmata archaeon]|nr:SRPBCC family protein [Thermoplasmata archaeon]
MEVECETIISRSRALVASYMFEPANDTQWTTGVLECRPLSPGRLRRGSRVRRTVKFGGKEFVYEYLVTDAYGDEFVEMKVEEPFPMRIRYELQDRPEGTAVRIHTKGEPAGFFRLAAPFLKGKVRKNIASDLANLKSQVEELRSSPG